MRRSLSRLILPLTFPSIRRSSFPVRVPSKTMFGPRKATPGARVLSLRGRLFFGGGASLVKRAIGTSDDVADGRAGNDSPGRYRNKMPDTVERSVSPIGGVSISLAFLEEA